MCSWWKRRTKMERCLMLGVTLLVVIAAILVTTMAVALGRPRDQRGWFWTPPTEICTTAVCEERAKLLLQSLDDNVDPCDDFYGYVCNNWMKRNPVPDDQSRFSIFESLRSKVQDRLGGILEGATYKTENQNITDKVILAYRVCTNDSIGEDLKFNSLKQLLEGAGLQDWPMSVQWDAAPHWEDLFENVYLKMGFSLIMDIRVILDLKNATQYVITFDQPEFGLGRNQLLNMSAPQNKPNVEAYKTYAAESIRIFKPHLSDEHIDAIVEDFVLFEAELAKRTRSPEERRNMESLYHRKTIFMLGQEFKGLNWLRLLSNIFASVNTTLTEDEVVVLREPGYYISTLAYIKGVKPTTLYNYIGWRVLQRCAPMATKRFRDLEFQFYKVVEGLKASVPIWKHCRSTINSILDQPMGRLYIDAEFSPQAKEDMESMVKDLKEAFSVLLEQNTWMDTVTKKEAAKKLDTITENIGYPDWLKNDTLLNERYNFVSEVVPGTPFLDIYISVQHNNVLKRLKKLRTTYNRSQEWSSAPAVVNAFYKAAANTITFPAGILQSPFYAYGLPSSVNMGAIGMIIGHEITHGFDDRGKQFDSAGNLRNWWTQETREKFDQRAKCFIDQYGAIVEEQAGMKVNGVNTQGENIADNGGIREAFLAYRIGLAKRGKRAESALPGLERFTSDQMFFISMAMAWCATTRTEEVIIRLQYDNHSPNRYRVNLPMGNFEEFSRAFNCPDGSRMNVSQKCVLW